MTALVAGVVISAVGATTGIVSAYVQGKQGQKSLDIQRSIGELDLRNKANLEKALQKTNSNNMQIKIQSDTITNIINAKTNALIQATIISRQASKDAEKRNLVIVGVGGAVVVVGALAVLKFS